MTSFIELRLLLFPVELLDLRTGREAEDTLVMTEDQIDAVKILGFTARDLIYEIYRRADAKVMRVGTPIKRKYRFSLSSTDGHEITISLKGGDSNG